MLDYVVDFYCHELMLVIEIDGSSHDSEWAQHYDWRRQRRLESWRFDDDEIKLDIRIVVKQIREWIVCGMDLETG